MDNRLIYCLKTFTMHRSHAFRRVQARISEQAEKSITEMKGRIHTVSNRLKTQKRSILKWLRNGFSFYYLKFFGLWKPETKMGTISDHHQLQQEQFELLREFVAALKINANSPKVGRTSIEEFLKRGDSELTFSQIKEGLLERATIDTALQCVQYLMEIQETKLKRFRFDLSRHKQYDAQFCYQKGSDLPMEDAERSAEASKAYTDYAKSLELNGLLPQMKRQNIKRCYKAAVKERRETECRNAEDAAWWRLHLDLRANRLLRPYIRRQTSDFLRTPTMGQWSTLALVCYIYSIGMYIFTLSVQIYTVATYPRNVFYLTETPEWKLGQTYVKIPHDGNWSHFQMIAVALAIKESFCLTPFVILASIYIFFSILGAAIYPLARRSEVLRTTISATVEVVALEIWTNFVMLRNMSTTYRIVKIIKQFFRGHINWSIDDFYFKITNLANICFNMLSRDRDYVNAG